MADEEMVMLSIISNLKASRKMGLALMLIDEYCEEKGVQFHEAVEIILAVKAKTQRGVGK